MTVACDRFCIIATRRTGSNHLATVLQNFPELASCGELFNLDKVSGIQPWLPRLRQQNNVNWQVEEDAFLKAYARGNPAAFLDRLETAVVREGRKALSFKVFEDQMDRLTLETAILSHPRTHLMLLVRRALDSYVSYEKARETDRWTRLDTTNLQISLQAESFAAWLEQQREWYRHWVSWSRQRGTSPVVLTYEANVDQPRRIIMWRFAQAARKYGVNLRHPVRLRVPGLPRQDRNRNLSARIANWNEFSSDLDSLGLRSAAQSYPL